MANDNSRITNQDRLTDLRQRLKAAAGNAQSTEQAADWAAGLYQEAAVLIDDAKAFQAECKELLTEIMLETGLTEIETSTAKVYVSKPSERVTYDRKGLDKLAEGSDAMRALLWPFRKVTHVDGSMVIRKGRQ